MNEVQVKTIEYADAEQEEMSLIQKHISSASSDEITLPTITNIDIPSLLLMQRDNDANKMDTDEHFILDDPKVHGKSKMKKDFCELGNITFNPPITLLSTFSSTKNSSIKISRSD